MSKRHASIARERWNPLAEAPLAAMHRCVGRGSGSKETDMRVSTRSLAAAIISGTCLLLPSVALPQTQSPTPGVSEPSATISDEKLDATAAAVIQVAALKQEYEQRIAAAPTADQESIA